MNKDSLFVVENRLNETLTIKYETFLSVYVTNRINVVTKKCTFDRPNS